MTSDASDRHPQSVKRKVICKPYHKTKATAKAGSLRKKWEQKSRCPQWADDPVLRQALLDEALVDPSGGSDMHGRPRRLWNAIQGWCFVGRSCNTQEPQYDCYPEDFPSGRDYEELTQRAERQVREFLQAKGNRR